MKSVRMSPYERGVLMSSSRRRPLGVWVVIVASIGAAAAFFAVPGPTSQAFFIQNHETITRNALPQIPNDVMTQILVGPLPGAGDVGTDAFFNDHFRHLDNAPSPAQMCTEAQQAWNTFDPVLLSGSQQVGGGLADAPSARAAFGALLHVQQDLYAHSNFVEDNVATGQPNRLRRRSSPLATRVPSPPGSTRDTTT